LGNLGDGAKERAMAQGRHRDEHGDEYGAAGAQSVALASLRQQRAYACRLTRDRALATLEDADAFVADRGLLTRTPDGSLPSLFGACHEPPYAAGRGGFADWPANKWWWGHALAERPGTWHVKVHRGKSLYLSGATVALIAPLCRGELARAERGEHGPDAARLVAHLAAGGPAALDDLKRELALSTAALRATRARLERVGAVVSRQIADTANVGGDTQWTSTLYRWDQLTSAPPHAPATAADALSALSALIVAGVRAAIVAPATEVRTWFSWTTPPGAIDDLITAGRLREPEPGWLAMPEPPE
jgi:hypothetical protein